MITHFTSGSSHVVAVHYKVLYHRHNKIPSIGETTQYTGSPGLHLYLSRGIFAMFSDASPSEAEAAGAYSRQNRRLLRSAPQGKETARRPGSLEDNMVQNSCSLGGLTRVIDERRILLL